MRRDWSEPRLKVEQEGRCRFDNPSLRLSSRDCDGPVEAAHVVGRRHDPKDGHVRAVDTVPLCRTHHHAYDARLLDLEPVLTREEMAAAVVLLGLTRAVQRINPLSTPKPPTIRT